MPNNIIILDAGSQYIKLIDRTIRNLERNTLILPITTPYDEIIKNSCSGIIITGSSNSVYDNNSLTCDPKIFDSNIPILGICYGAQLIAKYYNCTIKKTKIREDGQSLINIDTSSILFNKMNKKEVVLLTHGDSITKVSDNIKIIGQSTFAISAIQHKTKQIYGVQFHPEVNLTENGINIFNNFLTFICKIEKNFKIENRLFDLKNELKNKIGNKSVVVLASGGIDSTVCAKLILDILPKEQVHIIHINNGFMRMNESEIVKNELLESLNNDNTNSKIKILNKENEFISKLIGIKDPENKRKIIGDTFIEIIMEEIDRLNLKDYFLVQGTLRPDLIESASKLASNHAQTIKTHHNDTKLVRQKREEGLILEPLKDYHKDEVRKLGQLLGLSKKMIWRQPFPGPGLAIRILCQDEPYITEKFNDIVKKLKEYNNTKIKTILLPIKSVGVQGDCRTYSYVVGLMTNEKDVSKIDWNYVFEIANDIPKKIHEINRVVYIFGEIVNCDNYLNDNNTNNTNNTTKTFLTKETINQLRNVDHIINKNMEEYKNGLYIKKLSQVPIILIPVDLDNHYNNNYQNNNINKRSIVIRPFLTKDFMTGVPAIPGKDIDFAFIQICIDSIINNNTKCVDNGISRIMYDLTSKPPGTTEWE